jgi:hypothetical protein
MAALYHSMTVYAISSTVFDLPPTYPSLINFAPFDVFPERNPDELYICVPIFLG